MRYIERDRYELPPFYPLCWSEVLIDALDIGRQEFTLVSKALDNNAPVRFVLPVFDVKSAVNLNIVEPVLRLANPLMYLLCQRALWPHINFSVAPSLKVSTNRVHFRRLQGQQAGTIFAAMSSPPLLFGMT